MTAQTTKPTEAQAARQERMFAEQADKESVSRSGELTERLIKYATSYCKEQNLSPEELVFAAALFTVNLRETFPSGKAVFDTIAARAAQYYDENA